MSVLSIPEGLLMDIEDLNSRAWELNREDPAKAIELANEALSKSNDINYTKGIALAKKTLGACYIWTSKNDEGVEYCMQANDLFKALKDKQNGAVVYVNLGTNFYFLSDYDTAVKCYKTSYDLNAKISFEPGMADALNGIGTVYYTIGQNDKALEALIESEKLCKKHNNKSSLVKVQDGLGETYHNLKQYDKALLYFKNVLSLTNELRGNHQAEAYALDGLGRTHAELEQYDKAISYFNESLKIRREIGFKFGEATTLNNLGNLFVKKKDESNAIKYFIQACELSSQIGSKESIFQSSEMLAMLYEQQNNTVDALKYYKIFHQAKEDVRNLKGEQLSKSYELQSRVLQTATERTILEEKAKELENFTSSLTLMSKMGQQIISSLSVETIVNTAYTSINELMDATGFGIGLFKKDDDTIVFPLYIEGDETFTDFKYDVTDNNRLTVICFNTNKEIIINDFENEIGNYIQQKDTAPKVGRTVESLIYLPLKYKKITLGVITVQSFSKNAYNNYHVNILKNIATYIAIALENAKLYEEQENKVEERTLQLVKSNEEIERTYQVNKKINEIGRTITSNLNLGKIFEELYANLNEIMSVECFGVRLYRPETNTVDYKFEMEKGVLDSEVHTIPLTDEDNYTVWCIKNRKDIFLNDNKKEYSKYVKQIRVVTGDMPNSLLFTPMMIGEKLIGVITVQSFEFNAYEPFHLDILKTLSTYTAIALENASLYENMEEKVNERTIEVVKQKEEIEKTFENTRLVSEIGQEISSTFSISEIISKVYNSINKLMDATMFGIGIYNDETGALEFNGAIEQGQTLEDYCYKLTDVERPAVKCYNNQHDIVIHDFTEEFVNSKKIGTRNSLPGYNTESIIYIPLTQNNKKIGVITVQSFKVRAYNDYHLQLLKSLAIYAAIAIDNASLYSGLEDRVIERTAEIEKNYNDTRLLGEISKELSASLSVETIISSVYKNIHRLMPANAFGIAIYNKETNHLEFKGFRENDKLLDDFSVDVNDMNRLAPVCYATRKEIVINDFFEEYTKYIKLAQAPLVGDVSLSIIYLPLLSKGEIIGVITVQSLEKFAYTAYQVDILKNLGVSIGIALDNAGLYQDMAKSTEEIRVAYENTKILSEVAEDISSSLSVEKVISKVHSNVNKFMKADCFGIGLLNKKGDRLEFHGFVEDGELMSDFAFDITDTNRLAIQCFSAGKEIFINDFENEYSKYISGIRPPVSGKNSESILYLPVYSKEIVIGVITVQCFGKFAYTDYHFNILRNLAVSIGIALDNANLYQNLEEKVNERTQEVIRQKEQIEKTFENTRLISEIGKEITSTFSIEDIISKVYASVNKLMDGTVFGIGIYDPEIKHIVFEGVIERGVRLARYSYSIEETVRPAISSYLNQNDYLINNYSSDKQLQTFTAKAGEVPEGIIYVPVTQGDKKIGVITVQSFNKDAYTDYHVQLLKSLAIYAAIAIDNASLYNDMEDRVKERTGEITTAYENTRLLSQIAEDISASLSVETITSTLYENVNKLMDATMFGIGVYNPQNNNLEFKGFVEKNEVMPDFAYQANDPNRLAAFSFTNETEILINDYSTEYKKYIKGMAPPVSGLNSASIVYIPLYAKGHIIGVFTVQSFEINVYSDYQFNILKNLAVSIGIALDNANLYQNLEEKVKERTLEVIKQKDQLEKTFEDQRTLTKIGNEITSTLSVEEIIDKVYAKITSLMDASCFGVGLLNKDTGKLVYPLFIEGEDKFSAMVYDLTERDKLTYLCFNNNRDIVINDFNNEVELYVPKMKAQMPGGIDTQSLIFLPMVLKEKVIGMITVQSTKTNAYSDYQVQILKNLAVYVAIAIDNAWLYQNMEDMVTERTKEVTVQKELLEKNFNDVKLSAEIAKVIASSLSVETIVSRVYENVNDIMKAESFGIGLYNPATKMMEFSGFIEKGEKLPFVQISMEDKERYAVMCFEKEIEIIINDHQKEFIKYTKELKKSVIGETPESIVYLPLFTKDKKIGVLTAQCFTKNAFQDFHVNIIKNMALSIAIALDNASLYQNLEQKVEERTAEVHKQKAIIEEKNKDITDSIRYAKKIQQAIAPNIEEFNRNFVDSFILYKPKDIVSGDFFWFDHFGSSTVFAAADCTGHGVPGAFMSLICSDIMYKVINDQKIHSPAKALNAIDERLVSLIKKSSESSANDGMDIALCTYHQKERKFLYAGAHRPLLLIRNKEIIEYRPSKFSIGGHSTDGKDFALNEIDAQPGDVFYLLTDGYADQFGGDNGKKFKFKNFKDLVLNISDKPMKEQKLILDETFEAWKGTLEQIDDVCVIGVKV